MKGFDLRSIVNNFYRDIFEDETRPNSEAYLLLALPVLFGQIGIFRHVNASFVETMVTSLALLFGFTFSSLLVTAKYTPREDRIEEKVVRETRATTSYALLISLVSLIAVVSISILVVDYNTLSYPVATGLSAGLYYLLFHYLLVMIYLMRYIYLLSIGGAFEQSRSANSENLDEPEDNEAVTVTKINRK